MSSIFTLLQNYYDALLSNLNYWILVGFVGQFFFTMRFVAQWWASEKLKKSVIPLSFWFFSILGGILLFVYALYKKDIVFILGQGFGLFIYVRNIFLIRKSKK